MDMPGVVLEALLGVLVLAMVAVLYIGVLRTERQKRQETAKHFD